MFDPLHLQALTAILATGSFDGAAARLHVTPSAISQRIRALEDRTGAVLIRRGTPCTATPAGRRLAHHADTLALLDAQAARDLGLSTDRPTVRVAVNADSLATWFLPALTALPDHLFDLVIDDQDHSEILLRDGAVMAAITARADPVQGCDAYPLGALRYLATASPAFAARWFPDGPTVAALATAPALSFNAKDRLQADWAAARAGAPVALPLHRLATSEGFVTAACLGLGWGMNPAVLAAPHLATGALVDLGHPLDTPLHWQVSRAVAAPLAPLTQAIRQAARAVLVT
jgi:LysR family transcriptional regulator, chromosome initiation inhibitor